MRTMAAISELRARIAGIEGGGTRHAAIPFGLPAIDGHLPGGGLAGGALHEVAGSRELADDAAATMFLAGILARVPGPVFWCLRWRDLFAPALGHAGLDPDRVIHVEAGDDVHVLLAMEECLRHPGLAGVVGEVGRLSLTASRRLQLAAGESGVPAFVFRRASPVGQRADGGAAVTRWRIRAAPGEALDMPGLARPRWHVALERARGAETHEWIVEACDAQGRLALPAALVHRPAAADTARAAA